MTLDEALAYPFPVQCPSGPGTTVGTATPEDWEWLADRRMREGKAILGTPLKAFMAVKDEVIEVVNAQAGLDLATYVVGEHVKLMAGNKPE